jgi:hypothetical protein
MGLAPAVGLAGKVQEELSAQVNQFIEAYRASNPK